MAGQQPAKPVEVPAADGERRAGDEARPGAPQTAEGLCPRCGGSAAAEGAACAECGGTGRVTVTVGDA